mmetsp:Transcript_3197/g.2916  ORF Transcript_3197/g.2916 Transcript_3197/m.2916 type:complete len:194 (+) Transcript_3197:158-739(+)
MSGKINNMPSVNTYSEVDNHVEMGKSQKSDFNSYSRKAIIEQALKELPQNQGTKAQIFDTITRRFEINLASKSSSKYKGFQQTLSKCFRNTKGFYTIVPYSEECGALQKKLGSFSECKSWKEKTFYVLNSFPNRQAKLDDIKSQIPIYVGQVHPSNSNEYRNEINLWEKNLLKVLSKHDNLFDTSNSKSIFYL